MALVSWTTPSLRRNNWETRRDAKVVKYGPPFSLSRFLRIFGEADSKIELQLPKQLVPQLDSGTRVFPAELLRTVADETHAIRQPLRGIRSRPELLF